MHAFFFRVFCLIPHYYKIKPKQIPDSVKGLNDRLEYLLRPNGIMHRNVNLEKGWYKDAIGAVPGTRKDNGSVVAFLPKGLTGYVYLDADTGNMTARISTPST